MDSFWVFATVLVAVVAVGITYQQFWIAREKLKLDLFEKRFAVFAAARRMLSHILQHGTLSSLEELGQYRADVAAASFLFDADVTEFLVDIDRRAMQLWTLNETLRGLEPGPERTTLLEEIKVEVDWLTSQSAMLTSTFEPYMAFTSWRGTSWRTTVAVADGWIARGTEAIGRQWHRWRRSFGRR